MLVEKETDIPYVEALSLDECHEDGALTDLRGSESRIKIMEALQLIINDLNSVPHASSDEIRGDVYHILHLISYFINWPLLVGRRTFTNVSGKQKLSDKLIYLGEIYKDLWEKLYNSTIQQLATWQCPSTLLTHFTKPDTKVEIPRLGVVELLFRIVAESEKTNDIGKYINACDILLIA